MNKDHNHFFTTFLFCLVFLFEMFFFGQRAASSESDLSFPLNQPLCCDGQAFCFSYPDKNIDWYPGKLHSRDSWHDEITLKVKVCRSPADQVLFFKAVDIDDYTSDSLPVDPNGRLGGDNFGQPNTGHLEGQNENGIVRQKADENHEILLNFKVTHYPGDNFQILASENKAALAEPILKEQIITSPTITIWRQLHIELDDMGIVTDNQINGVIIDSRYNPLTGQSYVKTYQQIDLKSSGKGRFENGELQVEGESYRVLQSWKKALTVEGKLEKKFVPFTLVDDDQFFGDIPTADISKLSEVYAEAFILPVFDTKNNSSDAVFDSNSELSEQRKQIANSKNQPEGDSGYWTLTIFQGYQMGEAFDNDPNTEKPKRGRAWPCIQSAFIAYEEIKDWSNEVSQDNSLLDPLDCRHCKKQHLQDVVNHEVGHLLGLQHTDGIISEQSPLGGVMLPSNSRKSAFLSALSISKLRRMEKLPADVCPGI